MENTVTRRSGILLHPTSFPNPYGIGDLGSSSYSFIDFLEASGQKLWQILPLGPTGYGDSPYQAFSSFAGQPLVISPEKLIELNLLTDEDLINIPIWDPLKIDYGPAINYKFSLLRKAFTHFVTSDCKELIDEFDNFCENQASWLFDYALFMAVKDAHDGIVWTSWNPAIAFPTEDTKKEWAIKLKDSLNFYQFIQFIFTKQWHGLKKYANEKGIQIIGDIPIFVAFDSADVWANKELFFLDSMGFPLEVAGVPPDYFSEIGQLWGNPLYNWKIHKQQNYSWWIKRISHALTDVDILRIDHFRGFESYWAIPYGSSNAINGKWEKGPCKDLFYALENALGKNLPIIAEDLGIITTEVEDLRDTFKFPGMKILQFAFENIEENNLLPHHYSPNSVCYSGTHDNNTTIGWYDKASAISQDRVRRYMNTNGSDIAWDFIRICFGSVSSMAIVPIQDVLSFESWARMNTPGVAENNWQFRYTPEMLSDSITKRLADITDLFGR
ncbi:MAG: 4-alpha-glucanotransferase [Firmicutes bacterium HGW-Firmicutes-1]|jgi:4-alpha-glucanotransferase|nr:MAG: 4-alpha-glucanotransferase [Firmicutes bacterium HGW-Firmicutes-1]